MREKNVFLLLSKYRGAIMGFAALWILFFHEWILLSEQSSTGAFNVEQFIKIIGFCGVDIFLMLSGLGLTFSIKKSSLPVFYLKRLKRIILPFLFMGILRCVLEKWPMEQFWKNILCINFYTETIYSFLWFVPAIITLYLVFPLYYWLFSKSSNKLVFTAAAITLWLIISIFIRDIMRVDLFGFTNRIPVFMVGVLFGWITQNKKPVFTKLTWVFIGLVFILGLYLAYMTNLQGMFLLVQVSNCCIPNLLISVSLPFLMAKSLDLLNSFRYSKPVGIAFTKFFSFYGLFSLELYCVQEWLGGQLFPKIPYEYSNLTKNLIYLACATAMGFVLYFVIKMFWKLVDFVIAKVRPAESK